MATTAELKKDHAHLSELLRTIKAIGIDHPEAAQKLYAARGMILAYITKTDQTFYPPLEAAATNDSQMTFLLSLHAGDRKNGSKAVQSFFTTHPAPQTDIAFVTALGRIMAVLTHRIANEQQLVAELERLNR